MNKEQKLLKIKNLISGEKITKYENVLNVVWIFKKIVDVII